MGRCKDKNCKYIFIRNTLLYEHVTVTVHKTVFYAGSHTRLIFPHFSAPVYEGQVQIYVLIKRQRVCVCVSTPAAMMRVYVP